MAHSCDQSCKSSGGKKHMCQLRHEGNISEIDVHSAHPTVQCNKCQAKADGPEYVCNPRPL